MLKDKNFQTFLLIEIIFFLLISSFTITINIIIYNNYKQQLIKNNAMIMSSIVISHPELEEEIINYFITGNYEEQPGQTILEKYGLTDIDSLEYLSSFHSLKTRTIIYGIITSSLQFFIMGMIFFAYHKKQKHQIQNLSNYMTNVLNEKYNFDVRDYQEGDLSNLKNDIYKITMKLKEQSDIAIQEKKYLEETLSDISHQIKTPLTSMYVINDLLNDKNIEENKKKEFLAKNKTQLERIEWLVTSLLKMSRLDSGSAILKPEPSQAKEIIEEALAPLKIPIELKEINLELAIEGEIILNVDRYWTIEALVNIIKNAYEHTPPKGTLKISVEENPIYVLIEIKDNGCGIKKEDLPHIFERFYKADANKESIGIGLNLSRKIIDKQSGDISVKSKINEGTTFKIKFFKNIIETRVTELSR